MRRLASLILASLILSCAPTAVKKEEEKSWQFYYDLGMSSYQARNYSEAIANFHRAIKINPNEPKIWNALGIAYMEVKEFQKAENSFKKALQLNPNYSEARMNLGILYMKQGRYDLAVQYLSEAAGDEFFEKKHIAFYHLAKVYKALGRKKEYVYYLEKAVNYNPLYLEAQLELAEAYKEVGEYEKAEGIYKQLINNGYDDPYILYKLAEIYYLMGDYQRARNLIKKLLYDYKLTEEQKQKVRNLLTQVLIAQQKKVISFENVSNRSPEKKGEVKGQPLQKQNTVKVKKEKPVKSEGPYYVQVGAFSTRGRAERLVKTLQIKGLDKLKIVETQGIYKVLYGGFKTPEEARKAKEELKKLNIYGFIVELK
ncbi:SPOR domain-containing protein [Aquifex sp.]